MTGDILNAVQSEFFARFGDAKFSLSCVAEFHNGLIRKMEVTVKYSELDFTEISEWADATQRALRWDYACPLILKTVLEI